MCNTLKLMIIHIYRSILMLKGMIYYILLGFKTRKMREIYQTNNPDLNIYIKIYKRIKIKE